MLKSLIVGITILGVIGFTSVPLTESKFVNNSIPEPAGNGNCTYANGMVMACPGLSPYNVNMPEVSADQPQPVQPTKPTTPDDDTTPTMDEPTPDATENPIAPAPTFNPLTDTNPNAEMGKTSTGNGIISN